MVFGDPFALTPGAVLDGQEARFRAASTFSLGFAENHSLTSPGLCATRSLTCANRRRMGWVRAKLRGSLVYARADESGAFVAEGPLVEVRYKIGDGRAYRARKENLEPIPGGEILADDAMGEAVAPEKKEAPTGRTPSAQGARYAAYTDGACTGNPGPAGLGVIVISPTGETVTEGSEYLGEGTNNIAELTAIGRALERSPSAEPIIVYTDSQYAIGVLSKGWKAKANKELIEGIRALLKGRSVAFEYVRGHSGIPMNERADELARDAITNRATTWTAPKTTS